MIKKDLEVITGILVNGDITYLVYELLKDSKDKESLLNYDSLLINKEISHKIRKGAEILYANNKKVSEHSIENNLRRPSLEDWLGNN